MILLQTSWLALRLCTQYGAQKRLIPLSSIICDEAWSRTYTRSPFVKSSSRGHQEFSRTSKYIKQRHIHELKPWAACPRAKQESEVYQPALATALSSRADICSLHHREDYLGKSFLK